MGAWFVDQVWPNLFAALLWVPIAGAGHLAATNKLIKHHVSKAVAESEEKP